MITSLSLPGVEALYREKMLTTRRRGTSMTRITLLVTILKFSFLLPAPTGGSAHRHAPAAKGGAAHPVVYLAGGKPGGFRL